MEVDIPSCALAFSALLDGSCLKSVKFVVNTAVSLPVEAETLQNLFEGKDFKKVSLDEAKAALMKDLKEAKLDEYRLHCLCIDLESLLEQLKNT